MRFGLFLDDVVEHAGYDCIRFCGKLDKQSIPVSYRLAELYYSYHMPFSLDLFNP
jgi:hypothetical protein